MKPWTPGAPIQNLPGRLPTNDIPENVDTTLFSSLASTSLINLHPSHLTSYALWFDMLAKTGKVRTHSRDIPTVWSATPIYDVHTQPAHRVRLPSTSWIAVNYSFKVKHGNLVGLGSGTVAFTHEDGWRIWVITTILESFDGHGNPDRPLNWSPGVRSHYHVIIVGGGQNGLALAARLHALGIDYVVLEKEAPGHRWVSRYDTVRQHTIREINNLPFGSTWSDDEEEFLPGERVAHGFRSWVERWGINVRTGANVTRCVRNGVWRVTVNGEELTAQHVAFALGGGLTNPRIPEFEGRFDGTMMHMVDFKNSKRWTGRGVVVGSGTAAHDIAQDMLDNGLDVTMIQRSVTAVYPIEWYAEGQRTFYKAGVPHEPVDRVALGWPTKISGEIQRRSYDAYVEHHREYFEKLEKVGFRTGLGDGVDRIPNEIVLNHFGGYYIDIGTSKHIADGDIKVVNGLIDRLVEGGLVVRGKELKADYIVLATGYETDYRKDLEPILLIARSLPPVWGLTEEGDLRAIMEEAAPGLWLAVGAAAHARFYSRFVALQIQEHMLRKEAKM